MNGIKTIKNTTIYKCIWCGKIYVRKYYAEKHHLKCRKSPKNVSICLDYCKYLEKKEFTLHFSNAYNEWCEKKKSFYCNKKDVYLKPRWAGGIDDYFCCYELPEIKEMPLTCKLYKL